MSGLLSLVVAYGLVSHREQPQDSNVYAKIGKLIRVDIVESVQVTAESAGARQCFRVGYPA